MCLFATARRASTTLITLMALMALLELCSHVLLQSKEEVGFALQMAGVIHSCTRGLCCR